MRVSLHITFLDESKGVDVERIHTASTLLGYDVSSIDERMQSACKCRIVRKASLASVKGFPRSFSNTVRQWLV